MPLLYTSHIVLHFPSTLIPSPVGQCWDSLRSGAVLVRHGVKAVALPYPALLCPSRPDPTQPDPSLSSLPFQDPIQPIRSCAGHGWLQNNCMQPNTLNRDVARPDTDQQASSASSVPCSTVPELPSLSIRSLRSTSCPSRERKSLSPLFAGVTLL